MPPSPETENQLLSLLDRHLRSTEATIGRLEARVDSTVTRLESRLDALGSRFDGALTEIRNDASRSSARQFYVQLLLVVVVAALGGANLYVQANKTEGVTIGTGDASTTATATMPHAEPHATEHEPTPSGG